jgi:hypothetical protein
MEERLTDERAGCGSEEADEHERVRRRARSGSEIDDTGQTAGEILGASAM